MASFTLALCAFSPNYLVNSRYLTPVLVTALWFSPVDIIYQASFGRRETRTLHFPPPRLDHYVLRSIHFTAECGTALRRWKAPSISLIVWQGQFISAHSPSSDRNQLTHCLAYPTQGGLLQFVRLSAVFQSYSSHVQFFCFVWDYDFDLYLLLIIWNTFPIWWDIVTVTGLHTTACHTHKKRLWYKIVGFFSPFSHFSTIIPINRIWWYLR